MMMSNFFEIFQFNSTAIGNTIDQILLLSKVNSRSCLIVDVAIPGDQRIEKKDIEKMQAYANIKLELSRKWNCESTVVPIIIKKTKT